MAQASEDVAALTEAELATAFTWLRQFMDAYESELVAMARGRFAEGSLRYPEGPLYRKTQNELAADIGQEIADALVYAARKLSTARP